MSEDRPATKIGLPATVIKLGWISFFADICSEMAYPILPMFLVGALAAPVWALGFIEGAAEALVSFMKGWSGRRSDVAGKRLPFVQWGYGLSAFGKPIVGLAFVWPVALLGRLLDRFGKGIRTTARDALIADAVEPSLYGKAYGFHRAMDTAGAFVGVAIALIVVWLAPGSYRPILIAALIPGLVAVGLTLKLVEPSRHETAPSEAQPSMMSVLKGLDPGYWRATILCATFALANTSDAFLLLNAKRQGVSDAGTIFAYMGYNVVVVLVSTWAGALSDRVGRWGLIVGSWALYGVVYLAFARTSTSWLAPLFGLYGLYAGISQGVSKALVADHAPKAVRGSAIGFFYLVAGAATLLGNVGMGLLWDRMSPETALQTAGVVALGAALCAAAVALLYRKPAAAA